MNDSEKDLFIDLDVMNNYSAELAKSGLCMNDASSNTSNSFAKLKPRNIYSNGIRKIEKGLNEVRDTINNYSRTVDDFSNRFAELEEQLAELKAAMPDKKIKKTEKHREVDDNGVVSYCDKTVYVDNPEYKKWLQEVDKLNEEINKLQMDIETLTEQAMSYLNAANECGEQNINFSTM